MGKEKKEVAVEVPHPQESLDFQLGHWRKELPDGRDLHREDADPLRVHGVIEEGHSGLG